MPQGVKPRGWYLARDAAQLIGVSAKTVGQWARYGYIKATRDSGPPEVFSYQDVAEGLAVHELLNRGATPKEVRLTVANCRARWGDWPLTTAPLRLAMAAKRAKLILEESEDLFDISHAAGRQTEFRLDDLKALVTLLRRGGWVLRDNDQITHIEVDPEKLSGKPSIVGRRIAAEDVAEIASEADGVVALRKDFRLSPDEIQDAVEWWRLVSGVAVAA
jgi:uncharacterized protein (DUF433 family)/DNA-binding transcriptional MerR regulator